jgi:hypothetical protein
MLAGHAACMVNIKNLYKIIFENHEGRRILER